MIAVNIRVLQCLSYFGLLFVIQRVVYHEKFFRIKTFVNHQIAGIITIQKYAIGKFKETFFYYAS